MSAPTESTGSTAPKISTTANDVKAARDHDAVSADDQAKLDALDMILSFSTIPVVHEMPVKRRKGGDKQFEYAELLYLGDSIKLKLGDGSTHIAEDHAFSFYNVALKLTYDQINALGGDFNGTYDPICQGSSPQVKTDKFVRAYNTVAQKEPASPNRRPGEAMGILKILADEVDNANAAIKRGVDPCADA